MTIRQHADRTGEITGHRAEDIHRWIDRFFDAEGFADFLRHGRRPGFNPYAHRRHRHCREALAEALEEFRGRYEPQVISSVFEQHVRDDYNGYFPYREDFETGGFREKYHEGDGRDFRPENLAEYFRGHRYRKMAEAARRRGVRFLWRFLLPMSAALILLTGSLFTVIVPVSRENMLNLKKQMIRELTSVAVGALEHYAAHEREGLLTADEARSEAAQEIRRMRYGEGGREYYWIIDTGARMVMHPYRRDLEGLDLYDYRDSEDTDGIYLFRRAVQIAADGGDGYIEYWWQHADDPGAKARKLSYVRLYPEWNWIVGTGVYIDDVEEELRLFTGRLGLVFGVIALISVLLLTWVLVGALRAQKRREEAEQGLMEARERYRALAEASSEGYMMVAGGAVLFVNPALCRILGRDEDDLIAGGPAGLLDTSVPDDHPARRALDALKRGEAPSGSWTVPARRSGGGEAELLVGISRIFLPGSNGHVVSVRRPLTAGERIGEREGVPDTGPGAPAADIVARIADAGDRIAVLDGTRSLGDRLTEMLETGSPAAALRLCVSQVYDACLSRLADLSCRGVPAAPVPAAVFSLGSNARREMTPFSDQDGAIVFADPPGGVDIESIRSHWLRVAVDIGSGLEAAGFPPCDGGVMPLNPRWCLAVSEWEDRLAEWSDRAAAQDLLEFNIVLDRRFAWGDEALFRSLDDRLSRVAADAPPFTARYAQDASTHRPPRLRRSAIDLKQALKPLEIQIRVLALIHGIRSAGTLERLNALHAAGVIGASSRTDLNLAFETFWALRFRKQLGGHRRPVRTDDTIDTATLSELELRNLEACLDTVDAFVRRRAMEIG